MHARGWMVECEGVRREKAGNCNKGPGHNGVSRGFTFRPWEALKGQPGCKVEKAWWERARPEARKAGVEIRRDMIVTWYKVMDKGLDLQFQSKRGR